MTTTCGVPLLAARIDGHAYAFAAADVREILRMVALRDVGHGGRWLAGVVDLRGELVPVLKLGELLGVSARAPVAHAFLVVLEAPSGAFAVPVDGVDEVYDAGAIQVPPIGLASRELLAGVARRGAGLVPVFDVGRLAEAAR